MKYLVGMPQTDAAWSHPSRGAWIEITSAIERSIWNMVAPLTGCVD